MVGGLKKKGLEGFFFAGEVWALKRFSPFFWFKIMLGGLNRKVFVRFFKRLGEVCQFKKLRQASPYQSFVGQDQSPKRAGKWWQFRGHGIKKKGQKRLVFVVKNGGFQKGKLGNLQNLAKKLGWIISIRSPPAFKQKVVGQETSDTDQISYIVFIYVYLEPICRLFLAWTITNKVLSHRNKSNQKVIIL